MGTEATNILPSTTGLNLGAPNQAWNVYANLLQVGGGALISGIAIYSTSIAPASVSSQSTSEQTFTVSGLATSDKVMVNPPASTGSVALCSARVSSTSTLALTFVNPTAGSLTPASGTYAIFAIRS